MLLLEVGYNLYDLVYIWPLLWVSTEHDLNQLPNFISDMLIPLLGYWVLSIYYCESLGVLKWLLAEAKGEKNAAEHPDIRF